MHRSYNLLIDARGQLRWPATACWLTVALGVAALITGCGPSGPVLAKVSGRVTLDDKPVPNAAVLFVPDKGGQPASAVTDADGKFNLTTNDAGDGAVLGSYRVTVTAKEVSGIVVSRDGLSGEVAPTGIQEKWLVPQRYSMPETSGLTIKVEPNLQPVELSLKSAEGVQ